MILVQETGWQMWLDMSRRLRGRRMGSSTVCVCFMPQGTRCYKAMTLKVWLYVCLATHGWV